MERICGPVNFNAAIEKVVANAGVSGVNGMTVQQLGKYIQHHCVRIIGELLSGTYRPQPVKRVEIPYPLAECNNWAFQQRWIA